MKDKKPQEKPEKILEDSPEKKKELSDRPPASLNYSSQNSSYREGCKCEPDNNIMFDGLSNPLSSKGN